MDQIHVTSKAGGITAIINTMGYLPVESVIAAAITADRRIGLVARLGYDESADPIEWAHTVITPMVRNHYTRLVIMHFMNERGDHAEHVRVLNEQAVLHGIDVQDEMVIVGDRFWSSCCTDPQCCPPEGEQWERDTMIDLEFAVHGTVAEPGASRDDIVALAKAGPDPLPRFAVLSDTPLGVCEDACQAVMDMLAGRVPDDGTIDSLGIAVASNIGFRDLLIGRVQRSVPEELFTEEVLERATMLVVEEVDWLRLRTTSIAVAQRVPDAPGSEALLSVLASFTIMDGVLARTLTERALAITPTYRLALLTRQMIQLGINPIRSAVQA